jgi:hypothetical protein
LASNGALVVHKPAELLEFSEDDLKRGFIVVPHDDKADFTSLPITAETLAVATNWWVERCLYAKTLVDPAEHVLCRPISNVAIAGRYTNSIGSNLADQCQVLIILQSTALPSPAWSCCM